MYKHAVQSSTDRGRARRPRPARGRRRQGLRQQRLLGHVPDHLAGVLAARPGDAGELVDGFVQQYRDGGWIARWSSPGYANLMTGTSSDVAFADAYVKGVHGLRRRRTPTTPRSRTRPSRRRATRGIRTSGARASSQSLFLGYTPDRVGEGVSWALEGDINDFGISNMAAALARTTRDRATASATARRPSTSSAARPNYVHMFDPRIGFFQGRDASGAWKSDPADYDPLVWGHEHDYTETDGWNFAFHAPQDGQGLANLYGGRDGLATKLDAFFATPGDRQVPRLLRRHDPRDDRGARRADGPVGLLQPGLAPHPVHVRLRRAAVQDAGEGARGAAAALLGLRDRPGLRRRRGQRRDVGLVPVQRRSASIRCRWAARTTRSARRCSRSATVHLGDGRELVVERARATARATSTCRACGSTAGGTTRRTCATPTSPAAGRSSSAWARGRRAGARHAPPRRRRSPTATRPPQPLHDATRPALRRPCRADELFDDDSSHRGATATQGAVRLRAAAPRERSTR